MSDFVGKSGRVTGRIAPGTTGEVVIRFQGGTNTFHAKPADNESVYDIDTIVTVTEFSPPEMVYVV